MIGYDPYNHTGRQVMNVTIELNADGIDAWGCPQYTGEVPELVREICEHYSQQEPELITKDRVEDWIHTLHGWDDLSLEQPSPLRIVETRTSANTVGEER